MELSVITIGNSRGIRLSKSILEKYSISDKIELVLEQGYMILKPKPEPRKGWEDAFKQMHERGDDTLLIRDLLEDETFVD
ncbi:antitoxin MazE [Runella defluvii]|uniref:Antitoxin MazE n=1 Tax=Runella defluvii TaxID=370973 RepID=A0A7W5ZJR5_9BACT|nr:AbrB/MazE/SpoVT family DNA-binding domain-containing protein [Runella defluvii]MBB3838164.1 antitoxin MazE [Runella defluvii]